MFYLELKSDVVMHKKCEKYLKEVERGDGDLIKRYFKHNIGILNHSPWKCKSQSSFTFSQNHETGLNLFAFPLLFKGKKVGWMHQHQRRLKTC